jgi:aspartate/methionine/tyrosine aminotransferase
MSCKKPKATFYAFPNVKEVGMDSRKLPDFLLNKAGVATLSGTAFGEYGLGYMRLSFANSIPNIEKALQRIEGALKTL